MLVNMAELCNHEKIRVATKWYHVLSESPLRAKGLEREYSREIEIEDEDGEIFYLRVRLNGQWEIERYILSARKWVPSYKARIAEELVGIDDYDYAVELHQEEEQEELW